MDPVLEELERKERRFFARVIFALKVITCVALLLVAAIIETALVVKVFNAEWAPPPVHASEGKFGGCSCSCTHH